MKKAQEKVEEFHREMGLTIGDRSCPDFRIDRQLRLSLIAEELAELCDALGFGEENEISEVGVCDALADLAYVVIGSAVTWGIDLEPIFDEVHRSNMTKTGGSRREDGKILKPATYIPPDIESILRSAKIST